MAGILAAFIVSFSFTEVHAQVQTDRYIGTDRYETAAKVCEDDWKESSDYVVLVNGENFPDVLSVASDKDFPDSLVASAVAAQTASPIVFVNYNLESTLKSIPLSVSYVNNFTNTIWQNDKYVPRATVLVISDTGVVKDVPVS